MKNPQYQLGMTYEEYCAWYAAGGHESDLFGPPGDPNVWCNPDGMKGHIETLKAHKPCNSLGRLALETEIKLAEERLKYLLHLEEQSAPSSKEPSPHGM